MQRQRKRVPVHDHQHGGRDHDHERAQVQQPAQQSARYDQFPPTLPHFCPVEWRTGRGSRRGHRRTLSQQYHRCRRGRRTDRRRQRRWIEKAIERSDPTWLEPGGVGQQWYRVERKPLYLGIANGDRHYGVPHELRVQFM